MSVEAEPAARAVTPLSRNRGYRLLWGSQALSLFGFNAVSIATPLLVLAVTGSATASGLVLGTIAAAQLVAGLPAGALADRWNRRLVMLACEAAQALAAASLALAVWLGAVTIAHLLVVAVVVGVCAALFEPAEDASLAQLVPPSQLSSAVALNSVRGFLGQVSGTAAGGFLFAVARALPFLADAVVHTLATALLSAVRLPARPAPDGPVRRPHLGREMAAGLSFVWRHRQIRVTALCAAALNVFFSAFYLVIVVRARDSGVPAGRIGLMAALLGVGGTVGALAAPWLGRRLSPYAALLAAFWALTLLTPVAAVIHEGLLFGALFFGMALLPPTANTVIVTRQLLLTPDELRGRLTGVLGVAMGAAAAVGPPLGGVLAGALPGAGAVLVCAAGIGAVTLFVTISRTLRALPAGDPSTIE